MQLQRGTSLNKLIFGLLVCFFSSMVLAQGYSYGERNYPGSYGCHSEMVANNGRVIQVFDGYDCYDAQRKCEDELYWRQNRGQNQRAHCRMVTVRPTPPRPTPPRPMPPRPMPPRPMPPRPAPQPEWVQVDQVTFRHSKTAVAIANCRAAREVDTRCNGRLKDYSCGTCSVIDHSDQSSYEVFQLINGRRPGPSIERQLERTFNFRDNQTAVARQKCENYRNSLPQCSDVRNYECTPCTRESHTDQSQFELYRLVRY